MKRPLQITAAMLTAIALYIPIKVIVTGVSATDGQYGCALCVFFTGVICVMISSDMKQ